MKKLFALLLVVAISICAFLAGVVVGPNLGSTEYEIGEVVLSEMTPGTMAVDEPFDFEIFN